MLRRSARPVSEHELSMAFSVRQDLPCDGA
jgi:hypothetical protein